MHVVVLGVLFVVAVVTPVMSTTTSKQQCSAGVVFLRAFDETPPDTAHDIDSLSSSRSPPSTYVIHVSYPCDSSPLPKIDKLKKSVRDPFVSFFLKPSSGRKAKRATLGEYGSGDFDDDDDDDDEDDEEDDEEEGDEEEDDHNNMIHELEPSNHVIPHLPTPTVDNPAGIVPPSYRAVQHHSSPSYFSEIQPTPTRSYGLLASTAMVLDHTTEDTNELEKLVFPNLGSGDGPLVLTTPLYNPMTTDESTTVSTSYNNVPSSSSSSYVPSSSYATPPIRYYLLHPIPKQLIYSGVPHNLTIPLNTFQPPCDSYDLLQAEPWVDVQGSSVRFFPTTEHISDYTLTLSCRQNPSATAELFVSVRQRQKSRLHNHAFKLEFGMLRGNLSRVQNLERIVDSIREQLGSTSNSTTSTSDLVVLSTELDSYPFRLSYVNESIISNVCPVQELKRIYESLNKIKGFIKLENVKLVIPPDSNQCDSKVIAGITGEEDRDRAGGGGVLYGENYPPSIKNQIDRLNGSVGEYLVYHVKEDFCYDPEDIGTRNLRLELRTNELTEIDEGYWLQFDSKNQEFFGLPMHEEVREFVLQCSDSGGKSANDVLELQITAPRTPPTAYNTEFTVHMQSIPFTPKAIRKFMEKLSQILSPEIQVSSYAESDGHVFFKWFNTSNPSTEAEVTEIRRVLLSDDGPVNKRLLEHFTPEFNISVASVVPLRLLLSENNPVDGGAGGGGGGGYFSFDENEQNNNNNRGGGGGASSGSGNSIERSDREHGIDNVVLDTYSGYLTTYIIPSVLIAVMILLALIIACLLSRKNKYTQASTEEDNPNSQAYIKNAKKGVPVIFQDELDEKLFGGQPGQRGGGAAREPTSGGNSNIYEPPTSPLQRPPPGGGMPPRVPQQQPPSTFASTPPSTNNPPRYHPHHGGSPATPQPPDYQNSISRSMRNRGMGIPTGGVGVLPHHPQQHHHHQHQFQHHTHQQPQQQPQYNQQIDSYAPPPGINYYGIHNSNSGGGFGGGGSLSHPHHAAMGGAGGSPGPNKMPPPPYVPP